VRSPKATQRSPLMRFRAPSTFELGRVHYSPACLTGSVPPSGFLTLSTAYASSEPPGLVSCRVRPWGYSLQGFSPAASTRDSSSRALPPGVFTGPEGQALASRVSPAADPYRAPRTANGRSPPGLHPLQGLDPHPRRQDSRLRSCAFTDGLLSKHSTRRRALQRLDRERSCPSHRSETDIPS
jgi:hypothetical protein